MRAIIACLVAILLLISPYRQDVLSLTPLTYLLLVGVTYELSAAYLEWAGIVKSEPLNLCLYPVDFLFLVALVGLTGWEKSPFAVFLILPVIFYAYDFGFRAGLIFSLSASFLLLFLASFFSSSLYFLGESLAMVFLSLPIGIMQDERKIREENLEVLGRIKDLLMSTPPLEDTLKEILITIGKTIDADAGAFYLYDGKSNKLVLHPVRWGLEDIGRERERVLERGISLEEKGVSTKVFEEGIPILVKDAKKDPLIIKEIVELLNVQSDMCFPLVLFGERRGGVHLIRRKGKRPFSEREFQRAGDLLQYALPILEKIELQYKIAEEHRLRSTLSKFVSSLATAIDIEDLAREVVYGLKELTNAEYIAFFECLHKRPRVLFHLSEDLQLSPSFLQRVCDIVMKEKSLFNINIREEEGATVLILTFFEEETPAYLLIAARSTPWEFPEEVRSLVLSLTPESENALRRARDRTELQKYAFHDPLTGLLNRRNFYRRMAEEFRRAMRYNYPLSIAFLDLDNFKSFNDRFGHTQGNRVLSALGRLIREHIRLSDFAARVGGEEFILVFPHISKSSATNVAERIASIIRENLGISVSIGVAEFPADAKTLKRLVEKADQAMYEAKKRGKGLVHVYGDDKSQEKEAETR